LPTQRREPSKLHTSPLFPYHFDLYACESQCTTACEWVPLRHDMTGEANLPPPEIVCRITRHDHDPATCLGNPLLGWSIEGLKAIKEIGAGRRWAPTALIGGMEPHDHLSVSKSSASKSPELTPSGGGILPLGRCRGGWGPTDLTADDLWDVSR
jgi:hypothetical protein